MVLDLPPSVPEPVVCSIAAAEEYLLAPEIVLAVAQAEGGRPGLRVKNKNGTFDIGSMQFNTDYLKTLRRYGISEEDAAAPGCFPFRLAAWRLKEHIASDSGDVWTRAANYHSRTPKYNRIYREKLIRYAKAWKAWLAAPKQTPIPWKGASAAAKPVPAAPKFLTFEDYLKQHGF